MNSLSPAVSVRVVALAIAVLAALGILAGLGAVGAADGASTSGSTRANGCVGAYHRMAPGVTRVKFLLRCTGGFQPRSNLA